MKVKRIRLKEFKKEIEKLKNYRLITISALVTTKSFDLLYHFDINGIKTFKVNITRKRPIIESIINVFPSADFYEREIHDLFGVEFKGNPRLHEKFLLPDDWKDEPPFLKKK